jgi:hypothetical protein
MAVEARAPCGDCNNNNNNNSIQFFISSETSGTIQRTTRRHIPEDDTLQKKKRFQKREDRVHGSAMKKIETYCYSEILLLEILINFKGGRVK